MSARRMGDLESQLIPTTTIWKQAGEYPARKHRFTILMAIITTLILAATIFFAYNCSLAQPVVLALRFALPERNVFVLTLLTQLTMFSLAELTSTVMDLVRWAFSCSARGIPAFTFLALSRATNLLGVLYLVLGSTPGSSGFQPSGHRLWGCQRLFFVIVRLALGVLLLSDISFQSAYHTVHQFPITGAGIAPMTTNIINAAFFPDEITAQFWWYFPAVLIDGKSAKPISPPSNCTSDKCTSYFLPGYVSLVDYVDGYHLTASNYTSAETFITIDAPGYQLDFAPPDPTDPSVTLEDCELLGYDKLSVEICLKQIDQSTFIAGTSFRHMRLTKAWVVCPPATRGAAQCMVPGLPWQTYAPSNTKMTILSRRATTAFDRRNGTITDFIEMSDPIPTNYTVKNFFAIYEVMFYIPSNATVPITATINYEFIEAIASFFADETVIQIDMDSNLSKMQQFLATSILIFNNQTWARPGPEWEPGTQAALGTKSIRLVIAPYTLYGFIIGGFLSLGWCLVALITVLFVATPNLSVFPEIDFAGKVIHETTRWINRQSHYSISGLLSSLSNAGTKEIRNQMAFARFYTRISNDSVGRHDRPPVVIALHESENLQPLTRRSVLIYEQRR